MSETKHPASLSGQGGNPQGSSGTGGREKPQREPGSWRSLIVTRLLHVYFLITRSMTLGVRAAVFDDEGRVFLVRHSYVPGWHMPGGGMERWETARQALAKELAEEGNLEIGDPPELFAIYFNRQTSRRDHVVFYVCRNVRQTAPRRPDAEIREAGFYALDALPPGTTPATRRRLAEIAGERAICDHW